MSAALRANAGSVLTHQLRRRRSWMPWRRMTSHTWSTLTSPSATASRWPVQVACPAGGGASSWARIRRSVRASYFAGAPDRGASTSPASRARANRPRHFETRAGRVANACAIACVLCPSAAARIMRARSTCRCSLVPAPTQAVSVVHSSSVNVIGVAGRAMLGCLPRLHRRAAMIIRPSSTGKH